MKWMDLLFGVLQVVQAGLLVVAFMLIGRVIQRQRNAIEEFAQIEKRFEAIDRELRTMRRFR